MQPIVQSQPLHTMHIHHCDTTYPCNNHRRCHNNLIDSPLHYPELSDQYTSLRFCLIHGFPMIYEHPHEVEQTCKPSDKTYNMKNLKKIKSSIHTTKMSKK